METRLALTLSDAVKDIGVKLEDRELSLFTTYYHELLTWNKKINLVSVRSDLDIPIKHFIDSLTLLPYIKSKTGQVLDIGSGAGFPGIPLKIALNSLTVVLLESSRKKSSFLKHIIRSLNLTDITVINNRGESLMEDETYRGRFEVVISRATFKLPQLLRIGGFFLSPYGSLIAMKSKRSDEELTEASDMSQKVGLKYIASHDLTLPITGDFRKIIIYEKLP